MIKTCALSEAYDLIDLNTFFASMGPQLCSCGNTRSSASQSGRVSRFNGAATLQLRKLIQVLASEYLP